MGCPRRFRYAAYAVAAVLMLTLAIRVNYRPTGTPTERAHRICGQCGFSPERVEQLIDNTAHSILNRDELLEVFYGTFDEGDPDPELCRPCAEAVLDAAATPRVELYLPPAKRSIACLVVREGSRRAR